VLLFCASAVGQSNGGSGDKKGKKSGGGTGSTWLGSKELAQLLGNGPGACEALKKFLDCRPQDASPEVSVNVGMCGCGCGCGCGCEPWCGRGS
jgi:hypothetical protein